MKRTQLKNTGMLLLTAFIWGLAFVAQSVGMDYVGPFTFNAVRSIIGGVVLVPCIYFMDRTGEKNKSRRKRTENTNRKRNNKMLWTGGILCGTALCIASSLQQQGISYTTVGKAGFITAMYIVLVPILGIFFKRRPGTLVWLSVCIAVAGLYLLCIMDGFSIGKGDLYVLACAFVFSIHILLIDHFSPVVDGVRMSCIQFFVCGLLAAVPMFLFEHPSVSAILSAWASILYAGVLSCGVAYTLQVIAQKDIDPTIASLVLSLESVFSVLAGWVILGQKLSGREVLGCVMMFAAIILAQLPVGRRQENTQ